MILLVALTGLVLPLSRIATRFFWRYLDQL
jgi:hypothetical protein